MEKHIITHYESSAPTSSSNISTGYALGQRWFDFVSGIEYLHTSSGVWNVSNYKFSGAANITLGGTLPTITIGHSDTTRSDTTSSITPAAGATFSAISGVTTNSTGHVTAVNVKTITLPADTNTTYSFSSGTTQGAFSVTPSGSSAQSISIYGLGSNAYSSIAYLPLTGGTMTGSLKILTNTFSDYTSETGYRIKFSDNVGTANDTGIGISGSTSNETMWFNSLNGYSFYTGTNGMKLNIDSGGTINMYGGNMYMNLNSGWNGDGLIFGNRLQYNNGNEIGIYSMNTDEMIIGMYDNNGEGYIDTYSIAGSRILFDTTTGKGYMNQDMTFTGLTTFNEKVAATYDYTGLFNSFVTNKLFLFQPNIQVNLGGTSSNVDQDIKTWRSELTVNNTGTGPQQYDEIKSINVKTIYINDTSSNGPININESSAFEFNGFYTYNSGNITNAYSFRSDGGTFNGVTGNHCTNYYGVYLGAVTGATNNYGLYQNDVNAKNVYSGASYFNNGIYANGILEVKNTNLHIISDSNEICHISYDDAADQNGNTTINFRSMGDFADVAYTSDLSYYPSIYNTNSFQAVQWFTQGLTATGATFTSGNVIINSKLGVGTGSTAPTYPIQVGSTAGTDGISIYAIGDITAFSDESVKSELEIIPNAIDKVKKLNGYTYIRTDMDNTIRKAGVIAQEVQKVLPEVVTKNPDGTLSVAYANMVALLIEAIKEQQIEIDYLKSKLA